MPDETPQPPKSAVRKPASQRLQKPVREPDPDERSPAQQRPARRRWRSALWLVALGLVLSLQLWFPNLDSEVHDSYSNEDAGRRAFFELASVSDFELPPTRRNFEPLNRAVDKLSTSSLLCLLGPSRAPAPQEWSAILDWVRRGGSVLVAARWESPELEISALHTKVIPFASQSGKESKATSSSGKAARSQKTPQFSIVRRHPSSLLRTNLLPTPNFSWSTEGEIEPGMGEPLVTDGDHVQAVRLKHGNGTIVLAASDYIFSNDALADSEKDNAALGIQLVRTAMEGSGNLGYDPTKKTLILFDEFLNTTGTPKVVGVMFNHALRPLTVQILALLVLFGMTGSRRFGGLLPRATPDRRDITEHINSLGTLYYRSNSVQPLLALVLDRVRQELRLRGDKDPDAATLAAAAQRVRRDPEELRRLLIAAKAASQTPTLARRKGAALLRQLEELRQEIGRR